jgi:hypothetical protein
MPCSFSQCYGARIGTIGTITFCFNGIETGTGMHYADDYGFGSGSGSGTGIGYRSDIK